MTVVRDVLGLGSSLSTALAGWEHREGQLAMAEAVERALHEETHLFVEAGTGTGKTLAYLVPAVLSGRKVVVSTATRALQDQIYDKDLPLVASAIEAHGLTVNAARMKGLGNYVCLRRLGEARLSGEGDPDLDRVVRWAQATASGDRAELADVAEDAAVWRHVTSSSETRIGARCEHFDSCFVTRMRRGAEEAQIVVVNHHLFLADLALRTARPGEHASVLPAYDAVVFDEAHALEDVATEFFGRSISSGRIDTLVRDAERSFAGVLGASSSAPIRLALEGARLAARAFFTSLVALLSPEGTKRALLDADLAPARRQHRAALDASIEAVEASARERTEEPMQLIARRAADLRRDLAAILDGVIPDDVGEVADMVRWIDARPRGISLGASPVDVAGRLRSALFDRIPTVVCTSATLATGQSFHFARARLGAPPEARELVVASPFDFATQAVLYLPDDLPEPTDPAFDDAAAQRIAQLVMITGGGAFVLCTSARAMTRIHARLVGRIPQVLLLQGEQPKSLLLARFRASGDAVLVATMSFWEGVDVPGRALRLVIVDKIPFAPPSDPIFAARSASVDRSGGSGFAQYAVPSAAMLLKQGFGRLIRTQRDAGIVAILDRRIIRRGYGRALLTALPPAARLSSLEALERRWRTLDLHMPEAACEPRREIDGA